MSPHPAPRLLLDPVLDRIELDHGAEFAMPAAGGTATPPGLFRIASEVLDVSRRTLHRWYRGGVPWYAADVIANRLGLHPVELWGDAWAELDDAIDEPPRRRHAPQLLEADEHELVIDALRARARDIRAEVNRRARSLVEAGAPATSHERTAALLVDARHLELIADRIEQRGGVVIRLDDARRTA